MINRRKALLIAAFAAAMPVSVFAAGMAPFGTANFAAAREAGGPVLIHIHADWCPTCRMQKPILAKLLAEPKYKAVTAFEVDYDSEKPFMREVKTPDRSTIVVFAKGREVARSTGDTAADKITALIDKGM